MPVYDLNELDDNAKNLMQDLVQELKGNSGSSPRPDIYIERLDMPGIGERARVYVVWSKWSTVSKPKQHGIIMGALKLGKPEVAMITTLVLPLLPSERAEYDLPA